MAKSPPSAKSGKASRAAKVASEAAPVVSAGPVSPDATADALAEAVALLADDDPDLRRDGAEQLSDLPGASATAAMVAALQTLAVDTDAPTIGFLIAVLGDRGEAGAADAIVAVLDELGSGDAGHGSDDDDDDDAGDDDELAAVACEALGALGATQALPLLREAWRDGRWPGAIEELAAALARLGSSKDEVLFLATLHAPADVEVAPVELVAALEALQRVGGPRAAKAARGLHDHDDLEVAATAQVTGAVLDPAQRRTLATALGRTSSFAERAELLSALARAEHAELIGLLSAVVDTPAWSDCRLDALAMLVDVGDARAAAVLTRSWEHPVTPPWERLHAGALLIAVAPTPALADAVIELFATIQPDPTDASLMQQAGEAAIAHVTAALQGDRARLVRWAALLDELRREQRPATPALRDLAAEALCQLVGSDRFDAYERWREG